MLVAAAIAALVTIVPAWMNYKQADTKKANEIIAPEHIASGPPLRDSKRIPAPALSSIGKIYRLELTFDSRSADTVFAAPSAFESPFSRVAGLLFLTDPVGSEEPRQNKASKSIRDSDASTDLNSDAISGNSTPVRTASAEAKVEIPLPYRRPIMHHEVGTRNQSVPTNGASKVAGATLFAPFAWLKKLFKFEDAKNTPILPADADNRTAVYDIEAHVVYLPTGERLEAHSGMGKFLDDPRYVNLKDQGPTPPNTYHLALREHSFHGVQAIRLSPVGSGNMYGRQGMLAHSYMLGPNGQSNGCISVQDYSKFLHAFLKGDINRLIVVAHLERAPSRAAYAEANFATADTAAH